MSDTRVGAFDADGGGPDHEVDVDLWSEVIGQDTAVHQLQSSLADPVHAHLLVGPEGSGKRALARAFAADLLSHGLDEGAARRTRRLVASESHPSLLVVERDGPRISTEQAREVVHQAAMAPPEGDRQVIVLVDFHLVEVAGPQLLKTIEEPVEGTFFVVLAEELPPELVTIASRCVRVELTRVPASSLVERLVFDGVEPELAEVVAASAGGSLSRARLLSKDPAVVERRDAWYRAPERLDGTGARACELADALLASIDEVLAPLAALQAEEMAVFLAGFEAVGEEPLKKDLKRIEDRHKREQRRVRTDEFRSGLASIVQRYRDEVAVDGDVESFVEVAGRVQVLCDGLAFHPNEGLQLRALLVNCPPVRTVLSS